LLVTVVLFSMTSTAQLEHPRRGEEFKHQVERLEQVWRTAQMNGDVAAMDKLLSDDFVGITMTGQVVTKMQQLDRLRRRTTVLSRLDLKDVHVKIKGTTAIVTSLAEVEGNNEGEPMHGTFRYMRVYSRQPSGTWQITNFEATRVGPPPAPPEERGPGRGGPAEPAPKPE
jgi:ketosteroid isomerase-like protein